MSDVLLACGDRAMAEHASDHDGLPNPHPSCVIHAGEAGGLSCKVVDMPDLTGRTAFCFSYGGKRYKAGPIYPDDKTANNGQCGEDGRCYCVVPSAISLPFFSYNAPSYEIHCAVRSTGLVGQPGWDSRGYCIYRETAHDPARGRGRCASLKLITVKWPNGRCGQCGQAIPVRAVAEWGKDSNGHGSLFHLFDQCPPLTHRFEPRTDIGQDTFYCGCQSWD